MLVGKKKAEKRTLDNFNLAVDTNCDSLQRYHWRTTQREEGSVYQVDHVSNNFNFMCVCVCFQSVVRGTHTHT